MSLNKDKPHLWKADIERSIDQYNDWFLRFAPEAYRTQRVLKTRSVLAAFEKTQSLSEITPQQLLSSPEVLPILRMVTAPPLARDRLSGLAYVSKNLIDSMEGKDDKPARLPARMADIERTESLTRICEVIAELLDHDLFPWLSPRRQPATDELERAAAVVADRLTGATTDPIIRGAQEQRQLSAIHAWLQRHHYTQIKSEEARDLAQMPAGTYTFHLNLAVSISANAVNIPIDCVIKPAGAGSGTLPILIEAKSAGDVTNTNKRRKEEAQKFSQLRASYGQVTFILLLGGYFEPGYLGYEAAEGFDWIWEHRIDDLAQLLDQPDRPVTSMTNEAPIAYMTSTQLRESARFALQREVDAAKSPESRNRAGQYSTPFALAHQMTTNALAFLPTTLPIAFLEPALGAGVFYSALVASAKDRTIRDATGVELDKDYASAARQIFSEERIKVISEDFLEFALNPHNARKFNLLCTNPPYVRHHHIASNRKLELQAKVKSTLGLTVSGLSGLYTYFILLADSVLADDAVASWLVPSEFLVVNYGKALRDYLTQRVTLLELRQFDVNSVQFDDALVSSCVVTYVKRRPAQDHLIRFTFGADMTAPGKQRLVQASDPMLAGRWTIFSTATTNHTGATTLHLGDLFDIKRGIATGANNFFIVNRETTERYSIPEEFLKPILPSPKLLHESLIVAGTDGNPITKPQLFLLACDQIPERVKQQYPKLWDYLQKGVEQKINVRYLCASKDVWYFQERRSPSPFIATYMGRSRDGVKSPIRFLLNRSNALITNVYLHLYPRPQLAALLAEDREREIELLNTLNQISMADVLHAGRSYGGGLHKIEPKELAAIPVFNAPLWLYNMMFKQISLL